MPDAPRASVLLPCRDAASCLPQAIESLDAQTFTDFEIIAVDDGSTDVTRTVLDAWAARCPRVRVIAQPALGIVEALRTAARAARGDIFLRMDADDIAHADRFERQLRLLDSEPEIDVCGTLVHYFPRSTLGGGARRYERWLNSLTDHDAIVRDMFVECPIAHPTLAVRRHAFDDAGGYQDNAWAEDYDLVLRLWLRGGRFAKVPDALLLWREGASRASRTDPRYSAAAFRRCKVHYLLQTLARGRPVVIWGAGPLGKAFARELLRQGGSLRAFVDLDPRRIGQQIHGVRVLGPQEARPQPGILAVAAVGQPGARSAIRAQAAAQGWTEKEDFIAVA